MFLFNEEDMNVLSEKSMTKAERDELKDSEFGLPKKRQYPLHDKEHVKKAIQMFRFCKEEERKELAKHIKVRADDLKIKIGGNDLMQKYLPEED